MFITSTPALPLFASLLPQPLTGNVNWKLSIMYDSPGSYTYTCSLAPTVAASSTWNIGGSPPYCGGTATLSFTYGPALGSVSFTILGQNPSVATVKSLLVTGPCYAEQLANSESPGYLQFQSSGYPVFGSPNGYGIMQIDYNNSPYDVWDWLTNVDDGLNTISSDAAIATAFLTSEINLWSAYKSTHIPLAPAPYVATEGPCSFSISPASGEHPYSDAIAIKSYNSGPPSVSRPTGAYIYFANAWTFNTLSNTSPQFDYVYRVCTTVP